MSEREFQYFLLFDREVHEMTLSHSMSKHETHKKKLAQLCKNDTRKKKKDIPKVITDNILVPQVPEMVDKPVLVHNRSNLQFNEKELQLLNKGLNYALPSKHNPTNDIIIDVESGIPRQWIFQEKQLTRCLTERLLNTELKDYSLNRKHR